MFYAILAFFLLVRFSINSGPLEILKTSENLQNTSTFLETLSTYDALNSIQFLCEHDQTTYSLEDDDLMYYCRELIKGNDKYVTFKYIIETKINEIKSSLIKLLHLENKAIVCRGMRYLLTIIMYSIFINNPVDRSLVNESSGIEIFEFDELLKKKLHFFIDKNASFEKNLQRIKVSTTKNDVTNKNLGTERSEQSKGNFRVTRSSCMTCMDKIKTTVQLMLPFITNLDCFHNLNKIYEAMTTCSRSDIDLLLLIHYEIKTMYRTECHPDVDATALLHSGGRGEKFEHNFDSTSLLVGEIDRLSFAIRKDLVTLHAKFTIGNDGKQVLEKCPFVSIVLHHTFNRSRDPEVWRLIGDETVVDRSVLDMANPVARSMDDVVHDTAKNIDGAVSGITVMLENIARCRSYAYLNLIMKLYWCSLRALAENLQEVRRAMARAMEQLQDYSTFQFKDDIEGLATAECLVHDENVGVIDKLLDRGTGDKYFRSVYAHYWNHNARSVGDAIQTIVYGMPDLGLVAEFRPMLQEIRVQSDFEMKSVKCLVKWCKLVDRAYEDYCLPWDKPSTFSNNMKRVMLALTQHSNKNATTTLTLGWMINMIDTFKKDLEIDSKKI